MNLLQRLARHRRTTIFALATALDAFVHVANLLATFRTCFADFRARTAVQGMVVAIATHEVHACRTGSDTVEHQFNMGLLKVLAARG